MTTVVHLAKRAFGFTSRKPPSVQDLEEVREVLSPEELELWLRQDVRDRRHSIDIWRRFVVLCPRATVEEERAALLHDVGKIQSNLGLIGRVLSTIIGPRTQRFRVYHDHANVGAQMLTFISAPRTIELITGCNDEVGQLLRRADEI